MYEKIGRATIYNESFENIAFFSNSFDMIITSPPYNTGVEYTDHDDNMSSEDYRAFANRTMILLSRWIKPDGRICLEVGSSGRDFPLGWFWETAAYDAGLHLFSQIILKHRKSNQCAWGSYLKADAVYTIPDFHEMFVFYKNTDRKTGGETTVTKEEWMECTRGLWNINYSVGSIKEHPAQFPVELPRRCMRLFGHKGDIILDPFMGTGTTGEACIREDRVFFGSEISKFYYEIAKARLQAVNSQPKLL